MIVSCDALQRVWCIIDVSLVLTPVQFVPSGKDIPYLPSQYPSLEIYNMIYWMDPICWSQQGCPVWSANFGTLSEPIRARVHVRVTLVSHIYTIQNCQIISERTCQSHVYQSQYCQRLCQKPCQRPCLSYACKSHTCQNDTSQGKYDEARIHWLQPGLSDHSRAMFISAGIISEHVRDWIRAAVVRAILVRAIFIRAGIVRQYVRAHFHSWDCQWLYPSHTCQCHINQTTIVRIHIRAALVTVQWWSIPGSCYSTNLMRKISIVTEWLHTADKQVKRRYLQYVHIPSSWWSCLEGPQLSC